jgi:hypothetical protein
MNDDFSFGKLFHMKEGLFLKYGSKVRTVLLRSLLNRKIGGFFIEVCKKDRRDLRDDSSIRKSLKREYFL